MKHFGIGIIVASVVLAAATAASAQATCTSQYQDCKVRASKASLCDGARKQCMRTGRWVGPESGRDFGAVEKR
jgi:hypothetical protein